LPACSARIDADRHRSTDARRPAGAWTHQGLHAFDPERILRRQLSLIVGLLRGVLRLDPMRAPVPQPQSIAMWAFGRAAFGRAGRRRLKQG
jgi:hypothetical protein